MRQVPNGCSTPHIYKDFGRWWCVGRKVTRSGFAIKEAYDNWRAAWLEKFK